MRIKDRIQRDSSTRIQSSVRGVTIISGESIKVFSAEDSLAGLALESATSSASGESPLLCNAGSHPGTTWNYKTGGIMHQLIEQPDMVSCPGSRTIWRLLYFSNSALFSPVPLWVAFLQDPTSLFQRASSVFPKPRSKCQFSQGAVRCVIIPKSEKPSDTTSFHSVLVCHRTSWQKNKR
ncbi:hypothetical protein TNCV_954821 [Trichonephila clavipes]|nr:hypothetical protein TNCV_954821 [Trichonephila clavipes]